MGIDAGCADDEDRAGCVPDDLVRDAADQGAPDRSPTVAPDDDQVRTLGVGGLHDRLGRLALPDQVARRDLVAAAAEDELARRRLETETLLVHSAPVTAARQLEGPFVDHRDRQQPRPDRRSEPERFVGCGSRCRPKVCRQHDLADGRGKVRTGGSK